MGAPASVYENSSSFMQGIAVAVREIGMWDCLKTALEPDHFLALEAPRTHRWWPGQVLGRIAEMVEQKAGADLVERIGYLSVKGAVAPVAMPLIKVTFALGGVSPEGILSRASTFGATAIRGVDMQWKREVPGRGLFQCTYPVATPKAYDALWRGTLSFVFELTKTNGKVGTIARERDGAVLGIPVEWAAK